MTATVSPSDIVRLIDQRLPAVSEADSDGPLYVDKSHRQFIGSLISLLRRWDEVGLDETGRTAEFLTARATCEDALRSWERDQQSSITIHGPAKRVEDNPIAVLREILVEIPENAPDELVFVHTPKHRAVIGKCRRRADHALAQQDWDGAIINASKCLETLLLDQVEAARKEDVDKIASEQNQRNSDPTYWHLRGLGQAARSLDLIGETTCKLVDVAADLRNRVHRGKEIREGRPASEACGLVLTAASELVKEDLAAAAESGVI